MGNGVDHFDADGKPVRVDRYWVTDRFAARYWFFAQDALVWISACGSQSAPAAFFRAACLAQVNNGPGAGLYVGWTRNVLSDGAILGARFVLDRLLGANLAAPKESPPQRPFDHPAVWADLRARGLHLHPDGDGGLTELTYTEGGSGAFGLLAPSLQYVLVDEMNDEAVLVGLFGTPDAAERAVLIGGLEAEVHDWTEHRVKVALPRTGAGSSGEVVVWVRGHESNRRTLTEWNLQLTYAFYDTTKPPLRFDGPLTFRFRADVGDHRAAPHATPVKPVRFAISTRDSQAFLTASGTRTEGSCTLSYSGAAPLPAPWYDASTLTFPALARIDALGRTLTVGLGFGGTPPLPWKFTSVCSSGTVTSDVAPTLGLLQGPVQFESPLEDGRMLPFLPAYTFHLDDRWGVTADSYDQVNSTLLIHLEWEAAPAKSPPDAGAAQ